MSCNVIVEGEIGERGVSDHVGRVFDSLLPLFCSCRHRFATSCFDGVFARRASVEQNSSKTKRQKRDSRFHLAIPVLLEVEKPGVQRQNLKWLQCRKKSDTGNKRCRKSYSENRTNFDSPSSLSSNSFSTI